MKHKCKLHSHSLFSLSENLFKLKKTWISSESFIQSHPLIHPSPKNVGEFFSVFQEKKRERKKNDEKKFISLLMNFNFYIKNEHQK